VYGGYNLYLGPWLGAGRSLLNNEENGKKTVWPITF
jgi:hypothetical protein